MLRIGAILLLLMGCTPTSATVIRGGYTTASVIVPTADTVCTITTGNCTGVGAGTALFTAATCNGNGVTDDAAAFRSFNAWAVSTYRVAHPTTLLQLSIPGGKVCQFISGTVLTNSWGAGAGYFQTVGYGATVNDNAGTGGGFFFGCGTCGQQNNGQNSTVRLATVTAGSSSVTLLDTSKCSLFNNGDAFLITGIDSQGFGFPTNPDRFEWPTILSTASCAGSGVITLTAPLTYTYKSTWPNYSVGTPGLEADQGGPATAYQLTGDWKNTVQATYGLTIDQRGAQTDAPGRDISFFDITCPFTFCVIPSQNQYFRITNLTGTSVNTEVDKIVANVIYKNITLRKLNIQSAEITNFSCDRCTIGPLGVDGTSRTTTFTNSNLADLQLGAPCCGASGALTITNSVVSSLELSATFGGSSVFAIDQRGTWASGTLTVPANMHINSTASACGGACTQLNVTSSAGWSNGIVGDGPGNTDCAGRFIVTVINSTTVTIPLAWGTGNSCPGPFGSLPLGSNGTFFVPGANIYLASSGSGGAPNSQVLQVADLSVGLNGETIISFNQNGSPYAGGLPTMPAGNITAYSHPAPSFTGSGNSGSLSITDLNGLSNVPFGSQATRVLTAANSGSTPAMPVFGPLSELDMTVTAACSGASSVRPQPSYQIATLGSATPGSWATSANAQIASGTPRVMTQTTTSGAQSGDSLAAPGVGTLILWGQTVPEYSTAANCGTASTTFTVKTNQGVVYP